jgi:16S rRNA processing protein RimM
LTEAPQRTLVAGRVGKPHGLDGSFYVVDAEPRLLALGSRVTVAEREAEIVRRAGTDARPILRLEIASDRDAAAALRGSELIAPRTAAPELEAGEYWAEDLVGCAVFAGDSELGRVGRMIGYPSCEVLEVGELLVPLVRDAVLSIDLDARRIDVDPAFLGL